MPSYLKDLQPLLILLLAQAMALIAWVITEKMRRRYRRRDLMQAVVDELLTLQLTMAAVAYKQRSRNLDVTDSFLDLILPVVEDYHGPDRNEKLVESLRRSRAAPEEQRLAVHHALKKPNAGLLLKQYALPLFVTQVADLAICPLPF